MRQFSSFFFFFFCPAISPPSTSTHTSFTFSFTFVQFFLSAPSFFPLFTHSLSIFPSPSLIFSFSSTVSLLVEKQSRREDPTFNHPHPNLCLLFKLLEQYWWLMPLTASSRCHGDSPRCNWLLSNAGWMRRRRPPTHRKPKLMSFLLSRCLIFLGVFFSACTHTHTHTHRIFNKLSYTHCLLKNNAFFFSHSSPETNSLVT